MTNDDKKKVERFLLNRDGRLDVPSEFEIERIGKTVIGQTLAAEKSGARRGFLVKVGTAAVTLVVAIGVYQATRRQTTMVEFQPRGERTAVSDVSLRLFCVDPAGATIELEQDGSGRCSINGTLQVAVSNRGASRFFTLFAMQSGKFVWIYPNPSERSGPQIKGAAVDQFLTGVLLKVHYQPGPVEFCFWLGEPQTTDQIVAQRSAWLAGGNPQPTAQRIRLQITP